MSYVEATTKRDLAAYRRFLLVDRTKLRAAWPGEISPKSDSQQTRDPARPQPGKPYAPRPGPQGGWTPPDPQITVTVRRPALHLMQHHSLQRHKRIPRHPWHPMPYLRPPDQALPVRTPWRALYITGHDGTLVRHLSEMSCGFTPVAYQPACGLSLARHSTPSSYSRHTREEPPPAAHAPCSRRQQPAPPDRRST